MTICKVFNSPGFSLVCIEFIDKLLTANSLSSDASYNDRCLAPAVHNIVIQQLLHSSASIMKFLVT